MVIDRKIKNIINYPGAILILLLSTTLLMLSWNVLGQPDPPKIDTIYQPTCSVATGSVVLSGLPAKRIWTLVGTPGDIVLIGYGTSIKVTKLDPGTYTFTVSNRDGTSEPSEPVVINKPPPIPPAPSGDPEQSFCIPPLPTLSSLQATGTEIRWYLDPSGGTALPLTAILTERNYYASQTVGECESTARLEVAVTFISTPVADAGIGGEECDLDFKLNASSDLWKGSWIKISGPGNAMFTPDNHQPDALVTVDQYGIYDFAWTVMNGICSSSDIVRVIFHPLPELNAGVDTAVCRNGSIQLYAQGNGTFEWTPAESLSDPNIPDPFATPLNTTTYTVTLIDSNECRNTDNITVEVRDIPIADAGPDTVLNYTFETTLAAKEPGINETGSWSIIKGTGDFADSTYAKTKVSNLSLNLNTFLWTLTNWVCPPSNSIVHVFVNDLLIPSLITPNGDQKNEYFILTGIAALGKTELIIIDRWGAQVYKNSNYNNEWNGIDYNGNPLPADTYFYILNFQNRKSISGYVVIKR